MPAGAQEVQGTHSLRDWNILSCREGWPCGTLKSIEEIQQMCRELRMKQVIYIPVWSPWSSHSHYRNESQDTSVHPQHHIWATKLSRRVTSLRLGSPLMIWGKLTNPRNRYRLWEKTKDKIQEAKWLSQSALKGPVKVTWKQMWFDIIPVGTPPEKTDQPVGSLKTWTDLLFRTAPTTPGSTTPSTLPAPAGALDSPIWDGYPHVLGIGHRPRSPPGAIWGNRGPHLNSPAPQK